MPATLVVVDEGCAATSARDAGLGAAPGQEQGGDEGERGEADRPPEGVTECGGELGRPGPGDVGGLVLKNHGEQGSPEGAADLLEDPHRTVLVARGIASLRRP